MAGQNIKFKSISNVDIKADGDDFIIEAYGSIFGVMDSDRDIVEKGAFAKTINEMGGRISLCYQHDMSNPIGKMLSLQEDEIGLKFTCRISDAEPSIKQKIKEGILKEFSIGYSVIRYEEERTENERSVYRLKEIKLWEISLVTLAANEFATLQGIKSICGVESIEEEFDRIIINEKNQSKKFELLKLKHIALSEIASVKAIQQEEEPQIVISEDEVKYLKTYLNLI